MIWQFNYAYLFTFFHFISDTTRWKNKEQSSFTFYGCLKSSLFWSPKIGIHYPKWTIIELLKSKYNKLSDALHTQMSNKKPKTISRCIFDFLRVRFSPHIRRRLRRWRATNSTVESDREKERRKKNLILIMFDMNEKALDTKRFSRTLNIRSCFQDVF